MAKSKKRRTRKRKEPATLKVTGIQLTTMVFAALEYLKDAAMLISIGETMGDFADRGTIVDGELVAQTYETAFKIIMAGKAVVEAKMAADALNTALERQFQALN
jgi:hypothetical protein